MSTAGSAPLDFDALGVDDVERAIATLLGAEGDGGPPSAALSPGVVHVVATWRDRDGALRVLRIEERTPRSDHDSFLLNLARARAEGILTTGAILREEPGVRWTLQGPGSATPALGAWRAGRWPGGGSPWLAILTSGRDLDLDHPGLRSGVRPLLITGPEAARRLAGAARERGIAIAAIDDPGPRAALAALRARGARRITVEAGPGTAARLYDPPCAVDELWLTTYLGTPDEAVVGPELMTADRLSGSLVSQGPVFEVGEPGCRWRFERLRPAAVAPT